MLLWKLYNPASFALQFLVMQANCNLVLYNGTQAMYRLGSATLQCKQREILCSMMDPLSKKCSLGLRFHRVTAEISQFRDLRRSWEILGMSRCDFKYVHQLKFHVTALALPMVGYLKIYNLFIQWNSSLMQIWHNKYCSVLLIITMLNWLWVWLPYVGLQKAWLLHPSMDDLLWLQQTA